MNLYAGFTPTSECKTIPSFPKITKLAFLLVPKAWL